MPYAEKTNVGYLYSFLAIKWFVMFKTQSIHDNKQYRRGRELINGYKTINQNNITIIEHPSTTAEERAYLIKEYIENIENIKEVYLKYL